MLTYILYTARKVCIERRGWMTIAVEKKGRDKFEKRRARKGSGI